MTRFASGFKGSTCTHSKWPFICVPVVVDDVLVVVEDTDVILVAVLEVDVDVSELLVWVVSEVVDDETVMVVTDDVEIVD